MNPLLTYIPIIRWKESERLAFSKLTAGIRQHAVPLIEFVPKEFAKDSPEVTFRRKAKEVALTLGAKGGVIVDPWLLDDHVSEEGLPAFAERISGYPLSCILTTGPNRSATFQQCVKNALKRSKAELCLRVFVHDLRSGPPHMRILDLLGFLGLTPHKVHLLLDFQHIDEFSAEIGTIVGLLPFLDEWKSFTVAGGAFPKDLTQLPVGRQMIPRLDWLRWLDCLNEGKRRTPRYSDYTVQHGRFEEHEGKKYNFSASIRYTSESDWIVMRGEGVLGKDSPGYAQWPANAEILTCDADFCGADYSDGDSYIQAMGNQTISTGNCQTWLAAGINHHITYAVQQLNAAFLPTSAAVHI